MKYPSINSTCTFHFTASPWPHSWIDRAKRSSLSPNGCSFLFSIGLFIIITHLGIYFLHKQVCWSIKLLLGWVVLFKSLKQISLQIGCVVWNRVHHILLNGPQGQRHRGARGRPPPKGFKKRKIIKYGVFSCIKISFSVIFNKEIHALRGLLSQF